MRERNQEETKKRGRRKELTVASNSSSVKAEGLFQKIEMKWCPRLDV